MATAEVQEFDDATKELGDKIVGLSLLEAKALADYLKDVHGIEPAGGGVVIAGGAGGGGGGDEAAAEKANEAQGQSKPNEANPEAMDLSLEFPVFCGWAPLVCEAAQVVISFPNTLTGWWDTTNQKADSWASSIAEAWASVKEWATSEPDLQEDQTDLPIEEQTLDRDPSSFDTDYIVLGSQCPSFEPYTVEVGPISKTLSMDLSPLCDFAAQVRPAILGMSYLTAAGIVVAAIRET